MKNIMLPRPTCEIDFEYNQSQELDQNLICASLMINGDEDSVEEYWLHNQIVNHGKLRGRLERLRETHDFIAHAATAEAECFLVLGLDPTKFNWIDTYCERKQLTNKSDKFSYGRYFDANGNERYSEPPSFQKWKNNGKDNLKLKANFAESVGRHLGICVDTDHKEEMRQLILQCKPEYDETERYWIQKYCTSDILPLRDLAEAMFKDLMSVTYLTPEQVYKSALRRGRFAADIACMLRNGIPLDLPAIGNLVDNYHEAKDEIIQGIGNKHFPFYLLEKDKSNLQGVWKQKYQQAVAFITQQGLTGSWPKNKPNLKNPHGSYKVDEDTLAGFTHLPAIAALMECNKQVGQLKWFRPESVWEFWENVGSDGILRHFHGPFGTQTGRNAPPAKQFIFAMSSWLRSIIRPHVGKVVIAKDWGSQEFAVAAVMSKDPEMIRAYESGDPYLYFAKAAGAVPKDADPKLCKAPALVLESVMQLGIADVWHLTSSDIEMIKANAPDVWADYLRHQKYEDQRGLFKATTLGLQYGLGYKNLALKLTLDTGRFVSEAESKKLIGMHKKLYWVMWKWVEGQCKKYHKQKHLTLWDGWTLLGDNDNDLSIKNFPVQGTSAVIMRLAVQKATDMGVKLMCPLHDALYAHADDNEESIKDTCAKLDKAMDDAVSEVLGDTLRIRIDTDIHSHTDTWIEGKGKANYEMLGKFLTAIKGSEASVLSNNRDYMDAIKGSVL